MPSSSRVLTKQGGVGGRGHDVHFAWQLEALPRNWRIFHVFIINLKSFSTCFTLKVLSSKN
jgi:hypothetical protein